jgi:hypothetical protein
MSAVERRLVRADILEMADYGRLRRQKRAEIVEIKKSRRLGIGPFATLYFENYATMWLQVHEMLFIEKGGEEQIAGELDAYNPLIPQKNEIVATLMFEVEEPERRGRELARLGGVEGTLSLRIGAERVPATIIGDEERTRDDGKTSAVHFFRFSLTEAQAWAFRDEATETMFAIGHPNYGHLAIVPPEVRRALAADFS